MAWFLRLLSVVARDAVNFSIIQTLLMITLIIGAAAIAGAWKARREL